MLHVLSVAYPFAAVGLDAVGGAEQVLAGIDAALVNAGQRSTVLASFGSRVAGRLIGVDVGTGELSTDRIEAVRGRYSSTLSALLREQDFDLIHFHGCDCASYLGNERLPRTPPKLVTLHVPCEWYEPSLFRSELTLSFSCVSAWQREQLEARLPIRATIENGVDLARWRPLAPGDAARGHVACLGRISPEKGFDRVLRAARAADVPLLLAGKVFPYPEHERHFAEQIEPLLDDQRCFIGPVTGEAKRQFLARARCLVVASRVPETSSLVSMEALACGTPVVVAGPGAPASLIEEGVTGFNVRNDAELARALTKVHALDRAECRASAEWRFDLRQSTRRYLELYRELAAELRPASRVRQRAEHV